MREATEAHVLVRGRTRAFEKLRNLHSPLVVNDTDGGCVVDVSR
jgi:hypothetical protein